MTVRAPLAEICSFVFSVVDVREGSGLIVEDDESLRFDSEAEDEYGDEDKQDGHHTGINEGYLSILDFWNLLELEQEIFRQHCGYVIGYIQQQSRMAAESAIRELSSPHSRFMDNTSVADRVPDVTLVQYMVQLMVEKESGSSLSNLFYRTQKDLVHFGGKKKRNFNSQSTHSRGPLANDELAPYPEHS